jgi:hypothetical protein
MDIVINGIVLNILTLKRCWKLNKCKGKDLQTKKKKLDFVREISQFDIIRLC